MKISITTEEKEEFELRSYQKLDSLNKEIKDLKSSINLLEKEYSIWGEMYFSDKKKISQVLIISNDSEMHILVDKLISVKMRIDELCKKVDNSIEKNGIVDSSIQREYDLLIPVLEEDLENIKKQIDEADKENELFLENFNELEAEYKKCRQELKNKNKELLRLTNLYKKVLKNIKVVDELCEKNKKIPQKKLELVKF